MLDIQARRRDLIRTIVIRPKSGSCSGRAGFPTPRTRGHSRVRVRARRYVWGAVNENGIDGGPEDSLHLSDGRARHWARGREGTHSVIATKSLASWHVARAGLRRKILRMGTMTQEPGQRDRGPRSVPVLETTDELIAAVPWGRWRPVLVYRREHAGRTWVRLRTFNKHRTKGHWYPSPRFFVVPQACAMDLAKAIEAAAIGGECHEIPSWVGEFERQYAAKYPTDRSKAGFG